MNLRLLDMDDLLLLSYLLNSPTITQAAGKLKMSQPGATKRLEKIVQAFEVQIIETDPDDWRNKRLNAAGMRIAATCAEAVAKIKKALEK